MKEGDASPLSALPTELHPIGRDAYARYFAEPTGFDPSEEERLREGLGQLARSPQDLWQALASLGLLAILIQREGDEEGVALLRRRISGSFAHLRDFAPQIAEALGVENTGDMEALVSRQMSLIAANVAPKRAALHGEKAPEGAVRLKDVAPLSAQSDAFRPKAKSPKNPPRAGPLKKRPGSK